MKLRRSGNLNRKKKRSVTLDISRESFCIISELMILIMSMMLMKPIIATLLQISVAGS